MLPPPMPRSVQRVRRRTLRWSPVPIEGTVWDGSGRRSGGFLDGGAVQALENLFTSTVQEMKKAGLRAPGGEGPSSGGAPSAEVAASSGGRGPKRPVTLLDLKRSSNVEIALSLMRDPATGKRLMPVAVAGAAAQVDASAFSLESVGQLLKVLPTREEARKIQAYVDAGGSEAGLANSDRFFLELARTSRVEDRLKVVRLKLSLKSGSADIIEQYGLIEVACRQVQGSRALPHVLGVILEVGNQLNTGASKVPGFKLSTCFQRLSQTKSFGRHGFSLMHFVYCVIERKDAGILAAVHRELGDGAVPAAQRKSFELLDKEARELRGGIRSLAKEIEQWRAEAAGGASGPCDSALLESLLLFRGEAERALEEVERAAKRSVEAFEACLTYLGEPAGNMKEQPEAFFTTICDFLRDLRKIQSDGTALPILPP